MAVATVCKMTETDFNVHSKRWATTLERKFGAVASKQFAEVLENMFESKQQLLNDLDTKQWNMSHIMDTLHHDKSVYINTTFCNIFYITLKSIIHGKEYNPNKWRQQTMANNNIFDQCIRTELERIGYNKHDIMRISWRQNSFCLIYSRSDKKWCIAKITKTYINTSNEEWLIVKYQNKTKHIQRFCPCIKPIINNDITNNRLTLHFYGIMAPNRYKSKHDLLCNINKDLLVTFDSKLKKTDTIHSLKQLIRKIYNISNNIHLLIVFGDNIISSSRNDIKLTSFGITNHSLLLLAICRRNESIIKGKTNTLWNYNLSIKSKKGLDIITQQNNAKLYAMPNCGHYMNKESLYEYCLNQSKDGNNVYLACPHNYKSDEMKCEWQCRYCTFLNNNDDTICEMCDNKAKVKCNAKWNYCLIKQILSGDVNWKDLIELELLLSRNKVENECNLQKCPGCFTLYFKDKHSLDTIKTSNDIKREFKTHCIRCDSWVNSWVNSFCFCCGKTWNYGHICDSSFKSDLMAILNAADTKRIGEVDGVPSIRCCPNCAQLISHSDACKHMECISCSTEFCFVCLKPMVNEEWQCGSSGAVCPVAPRQSLKTLPNTIIINKKAFKLLNFR